MKFRFKVNKRTNLFITLFASVAIVAMMIVRFQYPLAEVWKFLGVALFFLFAIIAVAAVLGLMLRLVLNRRDK